METALNRSPT